MFPSWFSAFIPLDYFGRFGRWVALLIITGIGLGHAPAGEAQLTRISVLDHGAIPNDGHDDAAAVRAAVEACRNVPRPCLVFPAGTYHFRTAATGSTAFVEFNDFPEITLRGAGAELIGTGAGKNLFLFQRCGQVAAGGFDVDWDPLPFTAGRVVVSRPDAIEIEVVPPHPLRDDSTVQAVIAYDGERRLPLRSSNRGYYALTQKAFPKKAEIVGPGRLRIPISPTPEMLRTGAPGVKLPALGTHVLAWYRVRGGSAFRPFGCGSVTFEDIRVFCIPGMGFGHNTCDRVTLRRCQVVIKPGSGRWMSSTVDASHSNMVRQRVEFVDCVFEGMGDDATNVHGMYSMVHERIDARTLTLCGWKSIFNDPKMMAGLEPDDFAAPAQNSLRAGEMLEFSRSENPLVPTFEARIVTRAPVEVKGVQIKSVTLDRDLPDYVQAGSIVADLAEIPEFVFRRCTVRGGRGIGVRLKTRHAVVEDCTFEDTFGPGVWITCDAAVDHESIATREVTIRNNVFCRTNVGISVSAGRTKQYPEVHQGLTIVGNRFEQFDREAINIRSTKGALVRDNVIQSAAAEPIQVSLSSGVVIEKNTVVSYSPLPPR
jgi:hypothetical protein